MLKKKKKGMSQRKLKVKKKMIHAEKKHQTALEGEIEAEDKIVNSTN